MSKNIYFAGGCFWGIERVFKEISGVIETTVGYANGRVEYPSYEQVCRGDTGHRETVKVAYNPEKAKALLKEAGQDKGFTVELWSLTSSL